MLSYVMLVTLASLSEVTFWTHFPLTDQNESCDWRRPVVRIRIIIITIINYLERASSLLNKLRRMSLREAFIKLYPLGDHKDLGSNTTFRVNNVSILACSGPLYTKKSFHFLKASLNPRLNLLDISEYRMGFSVELK